MDKANTLNAKEQEIITSIYKSLLNRMPSETCFASYKGFNILSASGLEKALSVIVNSEEFKSKHQIGDANSNSGKHNDLFNDQSQFGEFHIILESIVSAGVTNKIVVDVGARGKERSNSYDLITSFGFKGILVEANPALIEGIEKDFEDLNIIIHNVAVSDYEGEAEFTIGVNDDVSSLNENNANNWGVNKGKIKVKVEKLSRILKSNNVPLDFTLLSVDIEGEDIKVLNEINDQGFKPRWIIAELSNNFRIQSLSELPLRPNIKSEYVVVGQTAANLILMRKQI